MLQEVGKQIAAKIVYKKLRRQLGYPSEAVVQSQPNISFGDEVNHQRYPDGKFISKYQRAQNRHAAQRAYQQNATNRFVKLPAEIVILIAKYLLLDAQLLLSLTTKHFRCILASQHDAALLSKHRRLNLLLQLEKDLQGFLTCRICQQLFEWKGREEENYRCPRNHEPHTAFYDSSFLHNQVARSRTTVTREIVDLIGRGYRYGITHGLPASYLDFEVRGGFEKNRNWSFARFEGRIIKHDFILYRSWHILEKIPQPPEIWRLAPGIGICHHQNYTFMTRITEMVKDWDCQKALGSLMFKCNSCATNLKVMIFPLGDDNQVRVEMEVWQNFGSCLMPIGYKFPMYNSRRRPLRRKEYRRRDLESDWLRSFDEGDSKHIDNTVRG